MEKFSYNNYPEGFDPPVLKKGQKAAFELIPGNKPDIGMPDTETVRIGKDLVDIAVVKSQNAKGEVKIFSIDIKSPVVYLSGDKPLQSKIYAQMMLSNHRADNPNRDPSKKARFRIYDPAGQAKIKNDKIREIARAQAVVADMTEEEVKKYFDIKGESSNSDYELLVQRLLKIAADKPKGFIKNKGITPEENVLDVFAKAKKAKFISFNAKESSWIWTDTGDVILTIPRQMKAGETQLGFFLPFMKEEKGRKVHSKLANLLEDN